ncbi:hypothetical protein HDU99_010661, partial [Rhizoclosmatium hyalinum]
MFAPLFDACGESDHSSCSHMDTDCDEHSCSDESVGSQSDRGKKLEDGFVDVYDEAIKNASSAADVGEKKLKAGDVINGLETPSGLFLSFKFHWLTVALAKCMSGNFAIVEELNKDVTLQKASARVMLATKCD